MALLDLFSNRSRPPVDAYVYDVLPLELRNQVVHILQRDIGPYLQGGLGWHDIEQAIACEHGLLQLIQRRSHSLLDRPDPFTDCLNYFLGVKRVDRALDVVEVAMRLVESGRTRRGLDMEPVFEELNHRFRAHGCGYQYEPGDPGQIVRMDSHLLHAETVRPALTLLASKGYEGPQKEFLTAHAHLRHGRFEEAIHGAGKAFESTMKAILDARRFKYDAKAAAKRLIQAVCDAGVVPAYSHEQLTALSQVLLGVATVRNNEAGHGAGATPRDVDVHYAAYALHMTASNIVFLIQCHEGRAT